MKIKDRDVIIIKKIINYCDEIELAHREYSYSYEKFSSNPTYKNAIALCLLQIGELSNVLSDEFKAEHSQIPWKSIKGMRNVVAHQYGSIDTETVWETAGQDVKQLKEFFLNVLIE